PSHGTIVLNGHNLETEREKALTRVGYMPDFSPVYENLKVWEYLDVFAAAYGMKAEERAGHVEKWLAKSDLTAKKESFIKGLSRGMRQRLVLAKTLEVSPNILLLDEPASGLDPIARKQMRDLLREAGANGTTILISSHILSELSEFVDSVIILEKGKLIMDGSLDEIRRKIGIAQKLIIRFTKEEEGFVVLEKLLVSEGIAKECVVKDRLNYVIHFQDSEEAASRFLKLLISTGVGLAECSLKSDDVEDIFLKVGAKEVA
ncbi:MAG: ABC transporter ATP-binding protein, partial [Candidatus Omnitrophica bacterium]|nr:ABC transporter ATP-binding protein [Candidatus Omnitrophota bacterium]